MKNKKGQLGSGLVLAISIPLIIGIIILSIVFGLLREQTSLTTITDDTFVFTNSTAVCTRITPDCIYSLTSFTDNSSAIGIGNFSRCTVGGDLAGVHYVGHVNDTRLKALNGLNVNATYEGQRCNYIEGGMTRTLVLYLPILLGVLLFVFVAGYIGMKGRS